MRALTSVPRRPFVTVCMVLVLGLALVAPLMPQQVALADPVEVVINLNDSGDGSLRQAIVDVDPGGEITFQSGLTGTITLGSLLLIDKGLTITGPGATVLTVSGAGSHNVFTIDSSSEVTISGLTITDGHAVYGGGIDVWPGSTIRVIDTTITNSDAVSGGGYSRGGGIYNDQGTVFVINSTISGNSAHHDGIGQFVGKHFGGALYNYRGVMTVIDSVISDNDAQNGGALYNEQGNVTFSNSVIADNTALGDPTVSWGGGFYNEGGTVTITDSTISGNDVLWSAGQEADGAAGGGIFNGSGTVTITSSTIVDNRAVDGLYSEGGGVYNSGGGLTITSSTFSGNDAPFAGGGIVGSGLGDIIITSSTIADNSAQYGSGIALDIGDVTLENTILDNDLTDTRTNCFTDLYPGTGSIVSAGHNLATDASCSLTAEGDLPSTNPSLGLLTLNGGATETHAITSTSPAYNAGGDAPCPTQRDQRGAPRPQGGACDIGAFEVGTLTVAGPTLTLPTDTVFAEATGPGGTTVDFSTLVGATDWAGRSLEVECDPELDSTFPITTSPVDVNCEATDTLEQTSEGSFTVHVQDSTAPVISDMEDGTFPATSPGGATVDYTPPTATDTVDGTVAVTCTPPPGSLFSVSTHTVTCEAEDSTGNEATPVSFTITVTDDAAPVINPVDDLSVPATDPDGATVNYPLPTASDSVDGMVAVTCLPSSGSRLPIGTTTVTCNAEDSAGNPAIPVSFEVTVLGARAQIVQLSHDIRGMDIPTGPKLTLTIFLRMAAVTAEQRYPAASCRFLETTAGLVTSFTPRFIDRADAADILADIRRIRTVMGC